MEPDFSGWATKAGLKCSDGRTIMKGAFKDQHGTKVPLVWGHGHNDGTKVLGHAILTEKEEGVWAEGYFNDTDQGLNAKKLVRHGDITFMSIYANRLLEKAKEVWHGTIREVSLVIAGANPGATIEQVSLAHGDGTYTDIDDAFILHTGIPVEPTVPEGGEESVVVETDDRKPVSEGPAEESAESTDDDSSDEDTEETVEHAEDETPKTVEEIYDTLNEDQKRLFHFAIDNAAKSDSDDDDNQSDAGEAKHSDVSDDQSDENSDDTDSESNSDDNTDDTEKSDESEDSTDNTTEGDLNHQEGTTDMTRNAFDQANGKADEKNALIHDAFDFDTVQKNAVRDGISFKQAAESFLAHAGVAGEDYGIEDLDVLFPDARTVTPTPEIIGRNMDWVQDVINGTKHSPFARIKSTAADLTADQARAKGYVKGNLKKEEVIKLLKRVTTPTTIYKKQKLDRDDIVDITDLDVVAWLKAEMRLMLNEEIARAILLGDGREPDDDDKVDEEKLRPIAYDNDMYAHKITLGSNSTPKEHVTAIVRARKYYRGTGTPTLYTTDDILVDLMLQEDKMGRRLYETEQSLAAALRVSKIVVVEPMQDYADLLGIIVNLTDYTVGADKGGNISMFDDFDIDYNQYKYLIETRISGALTKPKSALVIRRTVGTTITPQQPTYNPATHVITIPSQTGVVYKIDGVTKTGTVTITETTEVESEATSGYSFPHNIDSDWTFVYTP